MRANTKHLLSGLSMLFPGGSKCRAPGTGRYSVRYSYAAWLWHLGRAGRSQLLAAPPRIVGELGPGDIAGIGPAALLCGADLYCRMDAVRHASSPGSAAILDELVSLFKRRESIPDENECCAVEPRLDSYRSFFDLLSDELLAVVSPRSASAAYDGRRLTVTATHR